MKQPIGILIVEDSPAFVAKIHRQLRRARLSFHTRCIGSKDAVVRELECHRPDAILSNGGLPAFDGLAALAIAREKRPDVAFIFVAATAEKGFGQLPMDSVRPAGHLKSSLSDLAPTLREALREAKRRRELLDAELMALTSRWMTQ